MGSAVLSLLAMLLATSCQSPPAPGAGQAPFKLNQSKSVEITPVGDDFNQHRAAAKSATQTQRANGARPQDGMTEGDVYELPKFTVTQKGFLNFGLSVVTNREVTFGGAIEWMRVGVVLPGSPAAREGLFTGVEILAIDRIPVAHLSREDMLHKLFERESGEHVRLLVYSRHYGPLPQFVTLEGTTKSKK